MWLQTRMFLLVALMFGILYGIIVGVGTWMGAGSAITYIIIGFGIIGLQYLISPSIISRSPSDWPNTPRPDIILSPTITWR